MQYSKSDLFLKQTNKQKLSHLPVPFHKHRIDLVFNVPRNMHHFHWGEKGYTVKYRWIPNTITLYKVHHEKPLCADLAR